MTILFFHFSFLIYFLFLLYMTLYYIQTEYGCKYVDNTELDVFFSFPFHFGGLINFFFLLLSLSFFLLLLLFMHYVIEVYIFTYFQSVIKQKVKGISACTLRRNIAIDTFLACYIDQTSKGTTGHQLSTRVTELNTAKPW